MSKTIIAVETTSGTVTQFRDLHEGEQATVKAVLALHEQSRQSGATNPAGVIVFASIGEGPMAEFSAFATPDASNPIKAALNAARSAGTSSKTTLAVSVTGSPITGEVVDDVEAFLEQGGRAVLFIGTDRSVVIAEYTPVYESN